MAVPNWKLQRPPQKPESAARSINVKPPNHTARHVHFGLLSTSVQITAIAPVGETEAGTRRGLLIRCTDGNIQAPRLSKEQAPTEGTHGEGHNGR